MFSLKELILYSTVLKDIPGAERWISSQEHVLCKPKDLSYIPSTNFRLGMERW